MYFTYVRAAVMTLAFVSSTSLAEDAPCERKNYFKKGSPSNGFISDLSKEMQKWFTNPQLCSNGTKDVDLVFSLDEEYFTIAQNQKVALSIYESALGLIQSIFLQK